MTEAERFSPEPVMAAGIPIAPALLEYLTDLQKREHGLESGGATVLRQVSAHAPPATLSVADMHAIELLATMFDRMLADPDIAPAIGHLLAQLQIPLLKAALGDRRLLRNRDHPAWRLLDTLVQSGAMRHYGQGRDDPFYNLIERIVQCIGQQSAPQASLFSEMLAELENFLAAEQTAAEAALADAIAQAMRLEKMLEARALAENDVAERIETGEVASFVEVFLETQWVRILTLAHNIADSKPDALARVRKTTDDLIWSIKPKSSLKERKELISRLPALLALINAWLNVLKWDGPERLHFFSKLAKRHAAIARSSFELSPRLQVALAVNIAQKASDRLLKRRARKPEEKPHDQFTQMIDRLQCGEWMEFLRKDGTRMKCRLAWLSPKRSRFIFAGLPGHSPLSLTAGELAHAFRNRTAASVPMISVLDRAHGDA